MGVGMARLIEKLNSLAITKATKPGYYGDGAGLWLQVSPSITKSWIFRFTLRGNQREMGLGALHTVSLADARLKARECRQQLLDGIDPLEARKSLRLAASAERARVLSFDQCAAAYMDAHRNSWKNAKHAAQWESTIKTYATPVIGQLPVSNIDTALVIKVLSPIWQTRFDFFRRYGSPGSTSKETRQALRAMGFWKNYRISQNFLAFLFGPIYFAIKGMWRQALTFLAIWAGTATVLALLGASNDVFRAAGFGFAALYSLTANYAYFRHVNGERSWNPFAGLWKKNS
jgi:hypothetical protein